MKTKIQISSKLREVLFLLISLLVGTFSLNAQDSIYLSDMEWVSAEAGWNTVKKDKDIVDKPITVYDIVYTKGLGTHTSADPNTGMDIIYNIEGLGYDYFEAFAGLQDQHAINQVRFTVLVDNVEKATILVAGTQQAKRIRADVRGGKILIIRVNSTIEEPNVYAGAYDFDSSNWCSAMLVKDNGYACNMPINNETSTTDYWAKRYHNVWNKPLTVSGVEYTRSIGTRAQSELEFDIQGRDFKSFTALVGGVDSPLAKAGNKINFTAVVLDDCKTEIRRAEVTIQNNY